MPALASPGRPALLAADIVHEHWLGTGPGCEAGAFAEVVLQTVGFLYEAVGGGRAGGPALAVDECAAGTNAAGQAFVRGPREAGHRPVNHRLREQKARNPSGKSQAVPLPLGASASRGGLTSHRGREHPSGRYVRQVLSIIVTGFEAAGPVIPAWCRHVLPALEAVYR